ncbi:EF-TU receptor [Actinidia rufa]|uniref:EF-TU receptor n=1 Tax=Actinidia rufa TaxID=165716 RepID=A0A7J0F8M2_9ERIC|nr:EF-TU receptor [Actinidia rufa]
MVSAPIKWLIIFAAIIIVVIFGICGPISLIITRRVLKKTVKSSNGKVTNVTPVSLLEVKVTLPTKVIFRDESIQQKYDPSELAQLSKTRIERSRKGWLVRMILRPGSRSFGGLNDVWLSKMHLGFWYGGQVFIVHEYFCLGSLEQLLHGCEGTQFTPLSWGVRLRIAFCAAKAVASLHKQVTRKGSNLVCGVIKSSNILIQLDFSACLSGYETPYLIPPSTIVRRNPGRVAPELTNHPK